MPLASTCLPAIHSHSSFNTLLFLLREALTSVLSLREYLNQQVSIFILQVLDISLLLLQTLFSLLFLLNKKHKAPQALFIFTLYWLLFYFLTINVLQDFVPYYFFPSLSWAQTLLNTPETNPFLIWCNFCMSTSNFWPCPHEKSFSLTATIFQITPGMKTMAFI